MIWCIKPNRAASRYVKIVFNTEQGWLYAMSINSVSLQHPFRN